MANTYRNLSLALVPLLAGLAANPSLASGARLAVGGTIMPAACIPRLAGGELDYGRITLGDQAYSHFSRLAPREVTLTVACNAPSHFGITLRGAWTGALPADLVGFMGTGSGPLLPLIDGDGAAAGAFAVSFVSDRQSANGESLSVLRRSGDGPWQANGMRDIIITPSLQPQYSWTTDAWRLSPGRFTNLTSALQVKGALLPIDRIGAAGNDIVLRGAATLLLFHL